MTYVGIGFSTNKDPFTAAKTACNDALKQLHQKQPNIVILFSSIHFQNKRLLEGVYNIFDKGVNLIGCTGAGIITPSGIYKYGVAVMAIYSTKINYGISAIKEINPQNPQESGEQFARTALKNLTAKTRELCLIFSDGLTGKGSGILNGIKNVLGKSFPIIGASSADNMRFTNTFQYFNKEILNTGLVGIILSSETPFGYSLRHGWKPIGKPHIVTEAYDNIIKKIEDKPAVEIYENYFNKNRSDIASLLNQISILYPLGIYLPGEEEYMLRNVLRIDKDGSLFCQGDVPKGSEIRLMLGTKDSALQAAKQAAQEAIAELKENTLKGALIFESVSRIKLLGYKIQEEIHILKQKLGENTPFIGLCSFGEQAPLKSLGYHGESRFHNETIVILTIGERHAFI